jgi:glycosyltransferase involved in cell wall biosynthesis
MADTVVPKLCLNMIVKNESRIITRLLNSVKDIIDCYCICDTGSTDNTIELIEQFGQEHNLPGKVIQEPFRNFEYNRSHALRACDAMDADFVLLLDADMIFWKNPKITGEKFKQLLVNHGAFYIFQGSNSMYYKNTRIVKNKSGFYYKGVTHEYVEVPGYLTQGIVVKDIVFIQDIGDGGAKSDKFARDVRLLKDGLDKNPYNERYMFYLANSLKDLAGTQVYQSYEQAGKLDSMLNEWKTQFEHVDDMDIIMNSIREQKQAFLEKIKESEKKLKYEAITYYQKRIEAGGFWEEVWYSYYNMGKLYFQLEEVEKAVHCLQRSYILYPQRVENLYEIIKYYREKGENEMAAHFYTMAHESCMKYPSRDYLFIQKDVYDYKLDYEMTIIGYYTNPTQLDMRTLCMNVWKNDEIDDGIARNVLSNYKFYSHSLKKEFHAWESNTWDTILKTIGSTTLNIPSSTYPNFVGSTPSFCKDPKRPDSIYGLVRYVNYKVNDDGGYEQQEHIETKNVFGCVVQDSSTKTWTLEKEGFLDYDSTHDNLYVGLEDMRLFCHGDGNIYYTANRGLGYGKMVIEHGWINRLSFKTEDSRFLKIDGQRDVEKNWVMFANDDKTLRMVYNWYPIVLGTIDGDKFQKTHSIKTPYIFKYFRGSTNGIVVGNEIWFLCHIVSYEDRRYYYHSMVILDKQTLMLKNYTKLFTFTGEKVEYCLGMEMFGNELVFGYSLMDRETHYMTTKRDWFDENRVL